MLCFLFEKDAIDTIGFFNSKASSPYLKPRASRNFSGMSEQDSAFLISYTVVHTTHTVHHFVSNSARSFSNFPRFSTFTSLTVYYLINVFEMYPNIEDWESFKVTPFG